MNNTAGRVSEAFIIGLTIPISNSGIITFALLCTKILSGWNIIITTTIGINNSNDLAIAGGTDSGSLITNPFFNINLYISTAIKPPIIAVNNPFASRYRPSITGIHPPSAM